MARKGIKMIKFKKVLAELLAASMILTSFTVPTMAAEAEDLVEETAIEESLEEEAVVTSGSDELSEEGVIDLSIENESVLGEAAFPEADKAPAGNWGVVSGTVKNQTCEYNNMGLIYIDSDHDDKNDEMIKSSKVDDSYADIKALTPDGLGLGVQGSRAAAYASRKDSPNTWGGSRIEYNAKNKGLLKVYVKNNADAGKAVLIFRDNSSVAKFMWKKDTNNAISFQKAKAGTDPDTFAYDGDITNSRDLILRTRAL